MKTLFATMIILTASLAYGGDLPDSIWIDPSSPIKAEALYAATIHDYVGNTVIMTSTLSRSQHATVLKMKSEVIENWANPSEPLKETIDRLGIKVERVIVLFNLD